MKRFFVNTVEHSKDLKVEYFCIASIDDLIPVEKFQKLKNTEFLLLYLQVK